MKMKASAIFTRQHIYADGYSSHDLREFWYRDPNTQEEVYLGTSTSLDNLIQEEEIDGKKVYLIDGLEITFD